MIYHKKYFTDQPADQPADRPADRPGRAQSLTCEPVTNYRCGPLPVATALEKSTLCCHSNQRTTQERPQLKGAYSTDSHSTDSTNRKPLHP